MLETATAVLVVDDVDEGSPSGMIPFGHRAWIVPGSGPFRNPQVNSVAIFMLMVTACCLLGVVLLQFAAGRFGFHIQWWRQANPTPAVFLASAVVLFLIAIQIGPESQFPKDDYRNFTAGLTACGFALGGGLSLISAAIAMSRTRERPTDESSTDE
ncbi:MAG: hypothetical protein VB859_20705 [Planctomycetaceae bacterium]